MFRRSSLLLARCSQLVSTCPSAAAWIPEAFDSQILSGASLHDGLSQNAERAPHHTFTQPWPQAAWRAFSTPGRRLSRDGREAKPPPTPKPQAKSQLRRNGQIQAPSLRVVFPDGDSAVLSRNEALKTAQELQLDLVEIAAHSDPPVAKIASYGSLMYEMQKKQEEQEKRTRAKQKLTTPKELYFTPRIADHDLEHKLNRVFEFLQNGHRVLLGVTHHRTKEGEKAAARDALEYLIAKVQAAHAVEVGGIDFGARGVSVTLRPKQQQSS